jgi:NAD(P)-dependent dehydrogenase (short-subunit alcohol dehydrogenase family)
MQSLDDKRALITGAGSGIGRATALKLASRGAAVAVTDVRLDAADTVAAEIRAAGGEAFALSCDITDEASIQRAFEAAEERLGRLDIVHNNAAFRDADVIAKDIDVLAFPTWMWDQTMEGTLRGTMLGCRYAVKAMLRAGGGSIINTSSTFGLAAHNKSVMYGVAKAGINRLTDYVAAAFGRDGIRCNAVAPGLIMTPAAHQFVAEPLRGVHRDATALGVLGEPEDVAGIVAFLASDDARYVTGQVIRADGGMLAQLPTFSGFRSVSADLDDAAR